MSYDYNEMNQQNETENKEHSYGNFEAYPGSYHKEEEKVRPLRKKKGFGKAVVLTLVAAILVSVSGGAGMYFGSRLAMKERDESAVLQTVTNREDVLKTEGEAPKEGDAASSKGENKLSISTTTEDMGNIAATPTDVSEVVEHVMPAIVSINNAYDSVENFFGQRFTQKKGGSGSGIIIGQNKEEILIVTNNHVSAIKNDGENQKLTVTFHDETTADSTVKGADSGSDLAVLSVKVDDLSKETLKNIRIATLGNSDKMKVGQMVIAIGNALGYGQSTTVGYVSALNREVAGEDYTLKLLQTDAAINFGNSGGALLNTKGEVIGINSSKYVGSKIEGMGFAIPITTAIPIINDLMNREEIAENEQSYLGIMGRDVTENLQQVYGMPVGVYVVEVTKNSPAEKNGIKMGNIISEFNGYKIRTMKELQDKLAGIKAGKKVRLTLQVYQNGEYVAKQLDVVLGYRSEIEEKLEERKISPNQDENNRSDNGRRKRYFEKEEEEEIPMEENDIFDYFFNP